MMRGWRGGFYEFRRGLWMILIPLGDLPAISYGSDVMMWLGFCICSFPCLRSRGPRLYVVHLFSAWRCIHCS